MSPGPRGALLVAVSLVVAAAVVFGFLALGTPGDERSRALDRKRVDDLRDLAQGIRNQYDDPRDRLELPVSLDTFLSRGLRKQRYVDPVTARPYEYRKLAPDTFALCATFDLEVRERDLEAWQEKWGHPAGRACFTFRLRDSGMDPIDMQPAVRPSASPASPPTRPSGAR